MTEKALIGFGSANQCSNSNHCYNPRFNVSSSHDAKCYALFYGCEAECSGRRERQHGERATIYFCGASNIEENE